MALQLQIRRDTAANWTSVNPTLAQGELGYELDTGKVKVGDGSTAWASLSYRFGGVTDHTLLSNIGTNTHAQIDSHISSASNPHLVTKAQVGLGNADNTSDVNKPVSTAQALADTAVQNFAIQRANHTGTQTASTISDFSEAVDDRVGALIVAGSGISVTYNDPLNTLTIAASGSSFTAEDAQDAVGNILTDSPSIDFTYNDAGNTITAAVIPGGVDHNSLSNYVANNHIDHSAVSISAGTGLNGGGDLTASRTISMPNVGTAGTYGSATQVPVITTDAQGRTSSVTNTSIQIAQSQVTNLTTALAGKESTITAGTTAQYWRGDKTFQPFNAAAIGSVLTGLDISNPGDVVATDTILGAFGKLQANVYRTQAYIQLADSSTTSNTTYNNLTNLNMYVDAGSTYLIEIYLLYRTALTTTGIAVSITNDVATGTFALMPTIHVGADGTAGAWQGHITGFGDVSTATGVQTANLDSYLKMDGIFVCTTGGALTPQFRSEVAGSQVTVRVGSFSRRTRVS